MIKIFRKKSILLALTSSITLVACGGGGTSGGSGGSGGTLPPSPAIKGSQSVMISRMSTIPTAGDSIGNHLLMVNNFTGKNLHVKSFSVSGQNGIVSRSLNSLSQAMGGAGYDSRFSIDACSTLQANGYCNISFTPDATDGSAVINLIYTDNEGKEYSAVQMVNYSSSVGGADGFSLNNNNIENIASKNPYSVSIPFVADDNYESIDVSSEVITLAKSVSCNGKVTKGSHCTALLTLPAGPIGSYSSQITLRGTKADGTIREAKAVTGNTYRDLAYLIMTNGPTVMRGNITTAQSVSLNVINVGTAAASNSAFSLLSSDGVLGTQPLGKNETHLTIDNTSCTSPAFNVGGAGCVIKMTLPIEKALAHGYVEYQASYTGGYHGATPDRAQTKVYYIGAERAKYAMRLDTDRSQGFTNTAINNKIVATVSIVNEGTDSISNVKLIGTGLPSGASLSPLSCPSSPLTLAAGERCTARLAFNPPAAQGEVIANLAATADTNLKQSLGIAFSATGAMAEGFVIIPADKSISLQADKDAKVISTAELQFLSKTPAAKYVLNSLINRDLDNKIFTPVSNYSVSFPGTLADGKVNPWAKCKLGAPAGCELSVNNTAAIAFNYTGGIVGEHAQFNALLDGSVAVPEQPQLNIGYLTNNPADPQYAIKAKIVLAGLDAATAVVLDDSKTIKATATYTSASMPTGFVVDTSAMPLGWIENIDDTASTCPTTNKARSILATATTCKVEFNYFPKKVFPSGLYFYRLAASGANTSIVAPGYHITNPLVGLYAVDVPFADNAADIKASFTPSAYNKATAVNITKATKAGESATIQFTLAKPGRVNVVIDNDSYSPINANYCDASGSTPSCSYRVKVNKKDTTTPTSIRYIVTSSEKADAYNAWSDLVANGALIQ